MFQAVDYEEMRENMLSRKNIIFTLVKKVESVTSDDLGVTFLCEGRHYRKGLMGALFLQDDPALLPDGTGERVAVRLEIWGDRTVRIRLRRADTEGSSGSISRETHLSFVMPPREKEMVSGRPDTDTRWTLTETEAGWEIDTGALKAVVERDEWNLSISDREGRTLYRQYTRDEHSISHIVKEQDTRFADSYCGFESFPFGLGVDQDSGESFWTDATELRHNEHFYGFGEKFGPLDKLGQELLLWHCDALSVSTAKSYKNIPFFMSTRGYGVYVNSSMKSRFLMGSYHYKAYQTLVQEGEADFFIIGGPSMKEILSRYTDITGKPAVPPRWSFGLWMSKNTYRTQEELLSVAKMMREKKIPCDVMHLDVGWFEKDWMCDFEFSRERFPDPEGMSRSLREMGYRLSLWQLPYIKKDNKLYPEAEARGFFARNVDGSVSSREADGVLDFSSPDAAAWYRRLVGKLLEDGVDVIKVDFGESSEPDALYHRYDGREMHNLYPLLYNKAVWEETKKVKGEGIIWARSAYAGSQRYPLHWGGDSGTDFHGMYHSLRGGLSFGLSGFPFWSHDVGGYFCSVEPEVYIRWAQMGMFSSHMRMHGTTSREPWTFGEEIEAIFLKYARLRYRLIPYIYSQAVESAERSLPMLRALVLEFQDDPGTCHIDDQYLFGDAFLAAPMFETGDRRRLYLPAGSGWYDYWSKKRFDGGQWIDYHAPLDILPLFVREGSIIPMTPEDLAHTGEISDERFYFELYGVQGELKIIVHTPSGDRTFLVPGDGSQNNVTVFP